MPSTWSNPQPKLSNPKGALQKAGFSRPLDVVKAHLWSPRPRRGPCLASKREKPVK